MVFKGSVKSSEGREMRGASKMLLSVMSMGYRLRALCLSISPWCVIWIVSLNKEFFTPHRYVFIVLLSFCYACNCSLTKHTARRTSWKCNWSAYYPQSTYTVYPEYHSVCPLAGVGTPHPLSRKRVCFLPEPWGGGGGLVLHKSLRGRGVGSQFGRQEINLSTQSKKKYNQ